MEEYPLLSVIVPVYRVEKYLDQCVGSIVNQTYRNLEIILVDDGSPDNCGAMCDAWAAKDGRVRVIHKKNGGGGDARNAALDAARGQLIGMVDSDDYLAPQMYEHLYRIMGGDADIAECEIGVTDSDAFPLDDGSGAQVAVFSVEEAMRLHIQDKLFCQTPPNKLYRRSVIGDIRFPVGNLIDDEFWTYRVIGSARKLAHSSCRMYAYRQQQVSAMHKPFSFKRLEGLDAKRQRLEYLQAHMPQLEYEGKASLLLSCIFGMQMSLRYLTGPELEAARGKIRTMVSEITPLPVSRKLSVKENVLVVLAQLSLEGTCRLKNLLLPKA